ncbi:uncharacterized protein LOC115441536 [Manduca sexta]|uniref:Uncharacterized protein n=1 Tax=Manduca sexta TaxID=7130 RepID=A0A921YXZ5_MANSE|nr:uncharacterized protein LOC115441536 [Manduca sexta]KAG6447070.1 hypothetical protein O3G_MSEX004752 [Manduca sexta]
MVRVVNVAVSNLNRSIRNVELKTDKIKQEIIQMQTVIENIQHQMDSEKYQKDALSNEVDKCYIELNHLRIESDHKLASVWQLRADLSEATKFVAESCDARTLLIKATDIDLAHTLNSHNQQHSENVLLNRKKIEKYLERREKAITKRKNLLEKPEKDSEFIRIKEALSYSEQMVANVKNQEV